jgi:hypothetical protein
MPTLLSPKNYPQRPAPVTGRIAALVYAPNVGAGKQVLFLGTASGGIWRTTDFLPKSTDPRRDSPVAASK